MKVYVNNTPVSIFNGAKTKDAVLKYFITKHASCNISQLIIRDAWDNEIADDSPLEEGDHITVSTHYTD